MGAVSLDAYISLIDIPLSPVSPYFAHKTGSEKTDQFPADPFLEDTNSYGELILTPLGVEVHPVGTYPSLWKIELSSG